MVLRSFLFASGLLLQAAFIIPAAAQFVEASEAAVRTRIDKRTGMHRIAIEGIIRLKPQNSSYAQAGYTAVFAENSYSLAIISQSSDWKLRDITVGYVYAGSRRMSFHRGEGLSIEGYADSSTIFEQALLRLTFAQLRQVARTDSVRVQLGPSSFRLSYADRIPLRKLHEAVLDD